MLTNLGIRHPDTDTKKLALVILLVASKLEPDPDACYWHLQDSIAIFDRKRTLNTASQTVTDFHEGPRRIPDSLS